VRVEAACEYRYDGPEKKRRFEELAPEHPAEDALLLRNFGHFGIGSIPPEFYQEGNPYRRWIMEKVDYGKVFRLHALMARLVVAQRNATFARSVFKEPSHLLLLSQIVDAYPNAKFVWCHRDLQMALKSHAEGRTLGGNQAKEAAHILDDGLHMRDAIDKQDGLTGGIAALRPKDAMLVFDAGKRRSFEDDILVKARRDATKNNEQKSRFFDVCMDDLIEDPMKTMEEIYAHFDLGDLDPTFRARIRDFQATNTRKPRTDYTTPFHWRDLLQDFYQYIIYFPSTIPQLPVDAIMPIKEPPRGFFFSSPESKSGAS